MSKKVNEMGLIHRMVAPTPVFFKTLRTIGLCLTAAGGAVLAAPVTLPEIAINIAGYLLVAGGIMTAVSQAAVEGGE